MYTLRLDEMSWINVVIPSKWGTFTQSIKVATVSLLLNVPSLS